MTRGNNFGQKYRRGNSNQCRRAVFLDRDGVLNRAVVRNGKPFPPANVSELDVPADVPAALRQLKAHGFLLVVVTNQPDVARGTTLQSTVESINRELAAVLPLDDILVCYHTDEDECACRKPKPGLLLQAAQKHGIDVSRSFMVGDRWRDVDAGHNGGCATIWLEAGYEEKLPSRPPDVRVSSLHEAAEWIIRRVAANTETRRTAPRASATIVRK